jgi:EAL domain-containing protein (putative c-di-GMP-specific phosphodiesterase class I)
VGAEACRQIAAWRDAGLGSIPVSINMSARQLRTECFRNELAAQLAKHRVAPSLIALELTESAMVGDDATVRRELSKIRQMGMELHIDDFGTGYSSLSQLQNLDVDAIKIDRSFVSAIGIRDQGRVLCEAMVQMGRTLGFRVVAEGVETLPQLRELQAMRCDEIQGHYVSMALPASAVPALLARDSFFDPLFPVIRRTVGSS